MKKKIEQLGEKWVLQRNDKNNYVVIKGFKFEE